MITGVLGDVGQGKDIICTAFVGVDAVKHNRKVFSTTKLNFPNVIPLDINDLLFKRNWKNLNGSTILFSDIDEYLDNRASPTKRNKILSYFAFSHRKLDVDVYYSAHQLDVDMLRTHEVRLHVYTNRYIYPTAFRMNPLDLKEIPIKIVYEVYVRNSKGILKQLKNIMITKDQIMLIKDFYDTTEIIVDSKEEYVPESMFKKL